MSEKLRFGSLTPFTKISTFLLTLLTGLDLHIRVVLENVLLILFLLVEPLSLRLDKRG